MSNKSPSDSAGLALSAKARRTGEQPISFLMAAAVGNPDLINLAAGLVDPLMLPVKEMREITRAIFSDPARGQAALQYDTTLGLKPLRVAALKHLESLENKSAKQMSLTADDLLITTGSQQALYLIGDALIDPGDIVIAADPCYFVFTACLASLGAKVLTVPMDDDGIDVDAIEELLERLEREGKLDRVKLIYTTSYYQNPTGLSLSAERRVRLLQVSQKFSRRHRILILEDAAYRELGYDGPALASMKSLDSQNQFVILTQTFSKPFAPGLKTGYTAMPGDLLEALLRQKGNHDFGSASLTQHIALEAIGSGAYAKQVKKLCDGYRAKRDAMLAALTRYMPAAEDLHWTHPSGGLYVWLTLPKAVDCSRGAALFADCVENGVMYVPGDYCYQPDENALVPKHQMRLSFGQVAPDKIQAGIERLARAVKRELGRLAIGTVA